MHALTLDSTFIRSCEAGKRHLEVRIGNVETTTGRRQVFGAVARTDTDPAALIRRGLDAVGRTESTALTAFTDGCPGLRRILLKAGLDGLPILDWFHVAMRLRHLTQVAGGLSSDGPERAAAKAAIVEEVERLHWRLWNGRAKDAEVSIDRIRAVMHHFRGERGGRRGDWKYLKVEDREFLFDIAYDPRERWDQARKHPELLAELRTLWEAWNATMPPVPANLPAPLKNLYRMLW